jgi:hypothetical protein
MAGVSPQGHGYSNVERLPPGSTISKGSMNTCKNIAGCCVTARKKQQSYYETGIKDDLLLWEL